MSLGRWVVLVTMIAACLTPACATSFAGNANVPGGPSGCARRCRDEQMRMSSYVFVGAYSSACVCEPGSQASNTQTGSEAGGAVAAAVGVMMQMRRNQQRD
jgi:hypothetical protein